MAALVQTLPPQTTITMLQAPPASSGGYTGGLSQQQQPRRYHNPSTSGSYRGLSSGPIAPYAFTSTPQLGPPNVPAKPQVPHLRSENRSVSAPILPQISSLTLANSALSQRRVHSPAVPAATSSLLQPKETTVALESSFPDFASWGQAKDVVPQPQLPASSPSPINPITATATKPPPDRYRRDVRRPDNSGSSLGRTQYTPVMSSGSGTTTPTHLYKHSHQSTSSPSLNSYDAYSGAPYHASKQLRNTTADDMVVARSQQTDVVKSHRRSIGSSIGSIETAGLNHSNDSQEHVSPHPNAFLPTAQRRGDSLGQTSPQVQRPAPTHQHSNSIESVESVRSNRSTRPVSAKSDRPASPAAASKPKPVQVTSVSKQDVKLINVPQRVPEASKRNPSPLSRPMNLSDAITPEPKTNAPMPVLTSPSPAAEQLAALTQKDNKKSKSKIRRAFSFGSATELRRASAHNNLEKSTVATPSSKRNSKYEDELEPEQARIAEKQEAAGLGHSIYSGQGNFFTGSTDNLSISSTASSASMMLRKMGKGVKKSTRSLVGIFRPKSVIGVPAADGPVTQASSAEVSMVTVEAEREKVNVNANPHDQPGGGTGFPKLERNSVDAKYSTDSGTASSSRRSIVGGERERADVLAAVKKGILKRNDSGQSSPVFRPFDSKAPDFSLPQIPHLNDSPRSSAPSTPVDDQPPRSGHRRTDSIAIEGGDSDDYFTSMTRIASVDSKGAPLTPRAIIRNISFSPRIQFHDTWPSGEYDRRGDVATCNRLTPMLAQQIKEELNTFKMEMEVHESSKVYTHFF